MGGHLMEASARRGSALRIVALQAAERTGKIGTLARNLVLLACLSFDPPAIATTRTPLRVDGANRPWTPDGSCTENLIAIYNR